MKKQDTKIGLILLDSRAREAGQDPKDGDNFISEIKKAGHKHSFFYLHFFSVHYKENKIEIFYNNKKINLKDFSFFIFRYKYGEFNYEELFLLRVLKSIGIRVFNDPEALFVAKDKREHLLKLAANKIPITPTIINYNFSLDTALKTFKNKKIISKLSSSMQGQGVALADSVISFISFYELIAPIFKSSNILIQPFVEAEGQDYRLFVVGKKVVAAMKRKSNGIDFRSNLSKGGGAEKIQPSQAMQQMAIKAVSVLGLDYAGVDIIKDKKGKLMVLEVNARPGQKIQDVTGVNVVGEIIRYCIGKVR